MVAEDAAGSATSWCGASSRQREASFGDDLSSAEDFLLRVEHDKKAHVFINSSAGKVTFRAEAEDWLEHHLGADNTIADYRSVLVHHVYPDQQGHNDDAISK